MLRLAKISILISALLAGAAAAVAQTSTPSIIIPRAEQRSRNDPFKEEEDDAFAAALRIRGEAESAAKVPKALKEQHRLFLKTPDTGIARLFPAEAANILDAKSNNKRIPRECSFFSFSAKLHQRDLADLKFAGGLLKTGVATDSYGTIQPMGETSLEKITAETPEVVSMLKPRLPIQKKLIAEMMESAVTEAETTPGKTFLLRSAHSDELDQLIAFQIVDADKDGSITIIWKRLYRGKAPKFKE